MSISVTRAAAPCEDTEPCRDPVIEPCRDATFRNDGGMRSGGRVVGIFSPCNAFCLREKLNF